MKFTKRTDTEDLRKTSTFYEVKDSKDVMPVKSNSDNDCSKGDKTLCAFGSQVYTCLTAFAIRDHRTASMKQEGPLISSEIRHMLIAIAICLFITTTDAQPLFGRRYGPPSRYSGNFTLLVQVNDSNSINLAREHLGKFGWVEPADWTAISPRFNETIQEGESFGGAYPNEHNENETQTQIPVQIHYFNGDSMTEEQFEAALRNFQQANGLRVTGVLDEETMLMMTQLRCGVPDQTTRPNSTVAGELEDPVIVNLNSTSLTPTYEDQNSTQSSGDESSFSGDDEPTSTTQQSASTTTFSPRLLRKRRFSDGFEETSEAHEETHGTTSPQTRQEPIWEVDADVTARIDTDDEYIEEGEIPQTRVESMKEILAALRKEKLAKEQDENLRPPAPTPASLSTPPVPTLVGRLIQHVMENDLKSRRKKRSNLYQHFSSRNGWGLAFARNTITWRLVREWPSRSNPFMSANEVWFTVKLAFRMWSEILPRNFLEDNRSPVSDVDILIGFGSGRHNRCPVAFSERAFLRVYAHAWPLPKAEIHFNDNQPFVPVSWVPTAHPVPSRGNSPYHISLLKVAIHEIGHTLGLPHREDRYSVMNPYYQPYQSKDVVEIGTTDRQGIQRIYGTCEIPFDVVFDWVREVRMPDGTARLRYFTYFFRRTWFWFYENRAHRPRYGDPMLTAVKWNGVMQHPNDPHQKIDGIVQVKYWNSYYGPTFFFKGDTYIEYDNTYDRVKPFDRHGRRYPRRIADDFPGVPYPIDTVLFMTEDRLLYFFKENTVYRYSWPRGRLVDSMPISTAFPGWGGANALPGNIDAAYYSYAYRSYYFFKGTYYWKMAGDAERRANRAIVIPNRAVGPRQRISSKWKYICDVGESELLLNSPAS